MHSRIFQIQTTPVTKDEYLSDSDFIEGWFVGNIADYVSSDNDRVADIQMLRSSLETLGVAAFDETTDSFTILPGGKENYFAKSYEMFTGARDKTLHMGISEFASCSDFSIQVWQMKNAFEDKFGYYVSSEEFDTITFDDFIRSAEVGVRYYIGGILDYKY